MEKLTIKAIIFNSLFLIIIIVSASSQTAQEILIQVDRNLMPESYEAYRKVIDIEPNGKSREYIFYSVKKGRDKIALLFLAPASEKDRAILRLGDNMWLYIPNVGRPIRQTSLQSATGGVFNNADIMTLDYSVEYDASFLQNSASQYILNLQAKNITVAYDRLKLWINKDGLLLTKIECYTASGMLIKTLEFKQAKDFGNGIVRPSVVETHSPLYEGYRSIMIFGQIKLRELPDEVFTLEYMSKLGSLR